MSGSDEPINLVNLEVMHFCDLELCLKYSSNDQTESTMPLIHYLKLDFQKIDVNVAELAYRSETDDLQ
ncbi:hypothetical protein D3C73_1507340 [compost metagenome]